jgi:hypothetical protein
LPGAPSRERDGEEAVKARQNRGIAGILQARRVQEGAGGRQLRAHRAEN